jgi:hypothetical protein
MIPFTLGGYISFSFLNLPGCKRIDHRVLESPNSPEIQWDQFSDSTGLGTDKNVTFKERKLVIIQLNICVCEPSVLC